MLHILVDSNTVAMLLLKLMADEQNAGLIELRAVAPPSSSLFGAARTFLGIKNEPVAVVLDAKSTDQDAADRVRETAEEVIGEAGAAPLLVLVAVPGVEALYFERPNAVKRVFPGAGESLIEIGKVSPADGLRRLDSTGEAAASIKLMQGLDADDVAALRLHSPVKELLAFLADLHKKTTVTVTAGA
jgi:hypothetical protein